MSHDHKHPGYYEDEWWLEHLEGEHDANLREDLELLLRNSSSDRKVLQSLKRVRKAVKDSDDVVLPESGHYYDDLHSKIMAAVAAEEPTKSKASLPLQARRAKRDWASAFGTVTLSAMLGFVSWFAFKPAVAPLDERVPAYAAAPEAIEIKLAMVSDAERASFNKTMIGFQSESDFVTDAAADRLGQLSADQAEALLESLRN